MLGAIVEHRVLLYHNTFNKKTSWYRLFVTLKKHKTKTKFSFLSGTGYKQIQMESLEF